MEHTKKHFLRATAVLSLFAAASMSVASLASEQTTTVLGKQQATEYRAEHGQFYKRSVEANWSQTNGNSLTLHLFSDFKPGCAADIVAVPKNDKARHEIEFDFRKDPTGLLIGVQDPIIRLEYGDADQSSGLTYETVQLDNMHVTDLDNGFRRAEFTTAAKKLRRVAIVARGNKASVINSARFFMTDLTVDGLAPPETDLKVLQTDGPDKLLEF